MISFIVNYGKETNYSVNVCIQSLCFGGNFANHDNGCHSWRNDLVQAVVLDAFYDPNKGEAYRFAKDWTMENDTITSGGIYSTTVADGLYRAKSKCNEKVSKSKAKHKN